MADKSVFFLKPFLYAVTEHSVDTHCQDRQTAEKSQTQENNKNCHIYFHYGFKVISSSWFTNLFQIKVRAYRKQEAVTSIHVAARWGGGGEKLLHRRQKEHW